MNPKRALPEQVAKIIADAQPASLNDAELVEFLRVCNEYYRQGEPIISDSVYDFVFLAELKKRQPHHPYLDTVEPEKAFAGKTVALPEIMLSTEKSYSKDGVEKWLQRVEKAAHEAGVDSSGPVFRATPKLDGFAAYDDGQLLYTRGDGRKGTDISRVFERGLIVAGNGRRGQGAGEIVVSRQYFASHLADYFENARNFQACIIKEKELDEHALAAIENRAAVFFPFVQLPDWRGTAGQLLESFDDIVERIPALVDFDVDGVIFEVTDPQIKRHMGATRHHHRWQIAYKTNAEKALVEVMQVIPQTSRSGRVNPVAELQPTKLSGALIARATAHHYRMVKELGIGEGAVIELIRSGLVIPKIERVVVAAQPQIPEQCPSCGTELVWDGDYLYCPNTVQCPAQIETTIEHFFRTLGNIDGFGEKTIAKLFAAEIRSVIAIYCLDFSTLQALGFGDKTAQNLLDQLQRSRLDPIEDWRFLGAFGVYRMGLGNCEKLLRHFRLLEIFNLTLNDIVAIEGFAEKTGEAIISSFAKIKSEFMEIYSLGFNLTQTPLDAERSLSEGPLAGKTIVFTGAMKRGSRDEMAREAKKYGAKIASSVTGKTDYLVAGEDVGAAKIESARQKGVLIISEAEYLDILKK